MGSLWSDCIPAKFGNVWYIQYRLRERVHAGSRARACGSAGVGLKDHGRGSEESHDVRSYLESSAQGCAKVSKGRIVLINLALQNNKA